MNKNNKLFIILGIIVFLVLILIFYLLLSMKLKSFVENNEKKIEDVVKEIKNSNQEIVDQAINSSFLELRKIDEDDHAKGSDDASVGIIFYGDYDDEFSSEFNKTLKLAEKEFGEKIKIAFRHFPQRQHANSFQMALASECASEQDKFWEIHEKLFSMKDGEGFSYDELITEATGLGLNSGEFEKCVLDEKYKEKILNQIAEADGLDIIGTPTVYVNDTVLTGAVPWDDFVDSAGFERTGLKGVIEGELEK